MNHKWNRNIQGRHRIQNSIARMPDQGSHPKPPNTTETLFQPTHTMTDHLSRGGIRASRFLALTSLRLKIGAMAGGIVMETNSRGQILSLLSLHHRSRIIGYRVPTEASRVNNSFHRSRILGVPPSRGRVNTGPGGLYFRRQTYPRGLLLTSHPLRSLGKTKEIRETVTHSLIEETPAIPIVLPARNVLRQTNSNFALGRDKLEQMCIQMTTMQIEI